MAKTSLIIKSTTQDGKTVNKTLTDVNPDCSNTVLKTLGQKINALTTNFYGNTTRVDKIDCDLESDSGKITPTLTLSVDTLPKATVLSGYSVTDGQVKFVYNELATITYDGDGTLYAYCLTYGRYAPFVFSHSGVYKLRFTANYDDANFNDVLTAPLTIKVCATATDAYKAAEVEFTITE